MIFTKCVPDLKKGNIYSEQYNRKLSFIIDDCASIYVYCLLLTVVCLLYTIYWLKHLRCSYSLNSSRQKLYICILQGMFNPDDFR